MLFDHLVSGLNSLTFILFFASSFFLLTPYAKGTFFWTSFRFTISCSFHSTSLFFSIFPHGTLLYRSFFFFLEDFYFPFLLSLLSFFFCFSLTTTSLFSFDSFPFYFRCFFSKVSFFSVSFMILIVPFFIPIFLLFLILPLAYIP